MLYPKIQTIFKRTTKGELILGDWTEPEFEFLASLKWRMTEKIDGTNIRIIVSPDGQVSFGGRTDSAQLPAKLVGWLQEHFDADLAAQKFPDGAILYGEGFGAGIQKGGGNYQPIQSFILFDVRVGDWWLRWGDVLDVARVLNLMCVPVVSIGSLHEGVKTVSGGFLSAFGPFPAEGVVATPLVPLFNRKGERIITKIKTKDWQRAVEKK
jgi:hypothetical protein